METMTWKQFASLPRNLDIDGEVTFEHGPARADIHHFIREASVGYILSHWPPFDSIRMCRIDNA